MTVFALAFLVTWATACKDDEDKNPVNPQDAIEKTWRIGSAGYVKKDGTSVTSEYPNLTVTMKADGTYQTTNAKKLLFPSGTWSWVGTGTSEVKLDGDFTVTVIDLTATNLVVEFVLTKDDVNTNGRKNALVGTYQLSLTAQ